MISINNKAWKELKVEDVESAILEEEESFYFEFKDDEAAPKKIAEEVSALANTYGGYIFLGVSDDKTINGCQKWTEQRIHTMIHDAISPTPDFDVKKFVTSTGKIVLVIKIEEGSMPPYITNKGKIYERLSSGSFEIKDSVKLTQMYYQRESDLKRIEEKLTIAPIDIETKNIFGYVDIGFHLRMSNADGIADDFFNADLKKVFKIIKNTGNACSISRVGYTIVVSVGEVKCPDRNPEANLCNFIEIMSDGSVKLRILLANNEGKSRVNIACIFSMLSTFKKIYKCIFHTRFDELFACVQRYEKLTVLKQFSPVIRFDGENNEEFNRKSVEAYHRHIENYGNNLIITSDRIPRGGLAVLDKKYFMALGLGYNTESIINELFSSQYSFMGYIDDFDEE